MFLINRDHKTAAAIVSDFGRGGFRCGRGGADAALRCLRWRQWVTVEEDNMKDYKAVVKVIETGGSGMIIGDILCLFLIQKFPILLAPLFFSPLHGWVTHKSRKKTKCNAKAGIVCHVNNNDLGIPNSLLFQVGTH